MQIRNQELHYLERPTALQTQLLANLNRDRKKQSRPYKVEDFYMYQPRDERNLPLARNGAAAMMLVRMRVFPSWALFCYRELASASDGDAPELLAYISEDAILLAPVHKTGTVTGMLIAREEASGKTVQMKSPCGRIITTSIPVIPTKIIAEENVILRLK